jgi:hypothetical protein
VASVITIATREWKGVSSAGVTASYDAEAAEVSDDSPRLAADDHVRYGSSVRPIQHRAFDGLVDEKHRVSIEEAAPRPSTPRGTTGPT